MRFANWTRMELLRLWESNGIRKRRIKRRIAVCNCNGVDKSTFSQEKINSIRYCPNIWLVGSTGSRGNSREDLDSEALEIPNRLGRIFSLRYPYGVIRLRHENSSPEWFQRTKQKVIARGSDVRLELYGYCDASERTYGACVYIRSNKSNEFFQVQLLCSKSRVAPLKAISIPRLELCNVQLLAQLMTQVRNALKLTITKTYYWTDSSIVLHWIKATNKKLPVFVAHRIGEIQELISIDEWNHVGTKENPVDLMSRGVTPNESKTCCGGAGLNGFKTTTSSNVALNYQKSTRVNFVGSTVITISVQMDIGDNSCPFDKFSKLNKLIRVAATCIRFAQICKGEFKQKRSNPLSVDELERENVL